MTRRFSTLLLVLVSFAAGLLLANRSRESAEAVAQAPAPSRPTVATPVAATNELHWTSGPVRELASAGESASGTSTTTSAVVDAPAAWAAPAGTWEMPTTSATSAAAADLTTGRR